MDRGREPWRIRGGKGTGSGRRKGGKRDSQKDGNQEKRRKNLQYCVTFYNRNRTKRREHLRKGAGSGTKGYGRREFQTPCLPPKPWDPTTHVVQFPTMVAYENFKSCLN